MTLEAGACNGCTRQREMCAVTQQRPFPICVSRVIQHPACSSTPPLTRSALVVPTSLVALDATVARTLNTVSQGDSAGPIRGRIRSFSLDESDHRRFDSYLAEMRIFSSQALLFCTVTRGPGGKRTRIYRIQPV